MNRKLKIEDIAEAAGVSRSTVSRVLSNAPTVRDKTKKHVNRIIQELNYSPTALSRKSAEQAGEMHVVVLILPTMLNPFWGVFAASIQSILFEQGYYASILETNFRPEREEEYLRSLQNKNPIAVIAVSSLSDQAIEEKYAPLPCSVTFLDRSMEGTSFNFVVQDNFQAGYIAAKHLIAGGHRRILFLAGPQESRSSMDRVIGYRTAMEGSSLPVEDQFIRFGEMSLTRGREEVRSFYSLMENRPHAVVAANDETAVGFMDECAACGIRVPADVAVVSFDDTQYASLHTFDLTTVHQPIREMAKVAAELALHPVDKLGERRFLLQPRLEVRGSSGMTN